MNSYSGFALGGKARAGKNVIAEALASSLTDAGYWPTLLGFSEPLKTWVSEEIGHSHKHRGARKDMLRVGEAARAKDEDVLVNIMSKKVFDLFKYGGTPIITDVRMANEFKWCDDTGLFLIYVDAPVEDRIARLRERGEDPETAYSRHATEIEMEGLPWHHLAYNAHHHDQDYIATTLAHSIMSSAGWP